MEHVTPIKVLFVCMGNICRSPTAEGVFRKLIEDQSVDQNIKIDSAGTHAYHVGEAPDKRAQSAAHNRNIDLSKLRGRKFTSTDYHDFDYLLAMDQSNYSHMQSIDPGDGKAELSLLLDFATQSSEREVPDPYYGGDRGFERVLDMIQDGSEGLLKHIRQQHKI